MNNQLIDQLAAQIIKTKGITDGKKDCRNTLQNNLLAVSNILSFYAAAVGNTSLPEQVDLSQHTLQQCSGLKLIGIAETVLAAGIANLTAASGYGLTQAMLDALSLTQDAFTKLLNAPRNARLEKKKATTIIAALIASLRAAITRQLDKAMVLYTANTDLSGRYRKARIIVNSPTHRLALMVTVADGSGAPVAEAAIAVTNHDKKVLRNTSPLGNIRIQHLADGEHTLTATKKGCEPRTVSFVIAAPATTRLQVVMKKVD